MTRIKAPYVQTFKTLSDIDGTTAYSIDERTGYE